MSRSWAGFVSGMFCANSVPHLVTAARRGRLLTPFGGHDSGPVANLLWGSANVGAASAAFAYAKRSSLRGRQLTGSFLLGCAVFGLWAVTYEKLISRPPSS